MDQIRAVVHSLYDDPFREAGLDLSQLGLHPLDRREGVLAVSHDDDPADHVALPVEVCDASADVRGEAHGRHVFDADRRAVIRGADHDLLDVFQPLQVSEPADHVLTLGELEHHRADVLVRRPDRLHHACDRDPESSQLDRVDGDFVDLLVSAHRGDFAHAGDGGELVAEVPVLIRSQVRQGPGAGRVDEHVLIDPSETGRVRAEGRLGLVGQTAPDGR